MIAPANVANISTRRVGGALMAASFLEGFVGDGIPWAHLDIAGPAYLENPDGEQGPAATGCGVRTLLQLTMHYRKDERSKGRWQRELSAYLETGGKTVRSQQIDELDWSELPGDVRQIALSSQSREIDVQLWPIKAQNQRIGG